MANENAIVAQGNKGKQFQTALAKTQDAYVNLVVNAAANLNLQYTDYQKLCVMNTLSKMQELLDKEGLAITQIDQTNITGILQNVAMLNLNASASPRECYVITRNTKKADNSWSKTFEFGIEGDGNDKILRTYGVDIKKVHRHWEIRENDVFTYPSFRGIEIVPPTWEPQDYTSRVIRVVYPIEMRDGTVQYHISDREEVRFNLLAHISNNVMKNKEYADNAKNELKNRISEFSLDQLLTDKECLTIMSPAWSGAHSREGMIIRKLRNNTIKKIPKDFQSAFAAMAYEETFDDYDQHREHPRINQELVVENEVEVKAVSEPVDTNSMVEEERVEVIDKALVTQNNKPTVVKESKQEQMSAPF